MLQRIDECKEIISDSDDDEFIEMAKMDLDELLAEKTPFEEELKFMLIPKTLRMKRMLTLKFDRGLVVMRHYICW